MDALCVWPDRPSKRTVYSRSNEGEVAARETARVNGGNTLPLVHGLVGFVARGHPTKPINLFICRYLRGDGRIPAGKRPNCSGSRIAIGWYPVLAVS